MSNSTDVSAEVSNRLEELYPQWAAFLSRRFPSLRDLHEDFMQQAAEALLKAARKGPVQDWRGFGFSILKRRIADHFRDPVRKWAEESLIEEIDAGPATDPEIVAHYAAQLKLVVGFIAGLPPEDRHLFWSTEMSRELRSTPLSVAERKRLSRLRAQLRDKIRE
jgi:DNA-directed RNA polymerase specialized sigma24 family protein